MESSKISMLWIMKVMLLCDGYIVEFIHDAIKNYYEGEYMLVGVAIISSFLFMC